MVMDSERLRVFLAVAHTRNFSRAARELGKTQPSVSQSVARLEKELGQRLFVRDGRITHLTAAGKLLEGHAQRIFAEMDAARSQLAGLSELRTGQLVVGTSDTLACYLLPPILAAFRRRYPGVELRLDNRPSPATAARVGDRSVDLGVVTTPVPARAGLRCEPLLPQRDVVICPPGHPLARRRRLTPADLIGPPLLLLDRHTGSRAALEQAFARARPTVTMEMSSVEVLKRLVELGFGLSVVPALAVSREVAAGSLAAVALHGLPDRHVALALPESPLSPAAGAFARLVRDRLSGGGGAAGGGRSGGAPDRARRPGRPRAGPR
jgi:DNA-binding transcriptional LysR family regulator